jgi:hypothetical protein
MSKTSIKRPAKARTKPSTNRQPAPPTKLSPPDNPQANTKPTSKQSRVVEMLRAPTGATIAAMMKVTGWQQHSVRGFLAGAVKKKMGLALTSETSKDGRVYRIVGGPQADAVPSKRRPKH